MESGMHIATQKDAHTSVMSDSEISEAEK
ncbi:MAG TPA: class II aldolase, partial [Thalassospira sp.]|nr:class II aldolase [Thalassospira sp.]